MREDAGEDDAGDKSKFTREKKSLGPSVTQTDSDDVSSCVQKSKKNVLITSIQQLLLKKEQI